MTYHVYTSKENEKLTKPEINSGLTNVELSRRSIVLLEVQLYSNTDPSSFL